MASVVNRLADDWRAVFVTAKLTPVLPFKVAATAVPSALLDTLMLKVMTIPVAGEVAATTLVMLMLAVLVPMAIAKSWMSEMLSAAEADR